jgi:rod shape-determining protein MreB
VRLFWALGYDGWLALLVPDNGWYTRWDDPEICMINRLLGRLSHDIGIDLGTANTLVYVRGRGIVINEPSVVAVNVKTKQVLAIGDEAKKMVGKTPASIVATRPLVDGVVSDFEVTEQMLRYFINKVHKETYSIWPRPRVVIGIPSGVTEVEKRAVEDAATNAGARQTFLIEEPMAAAIGSRLPIQDAAGSMIVDIGGGTTEVAIISLGGIVASRSLRVAGDELSDDIIQYAREEFSLQIGERTAENIKIAVGSAFPVTGLKEVPMRGRDLITGLPKEIMVTPDQVRVALAKSVREIVEAVKITIEETPPELVADIMDRGIILAGGGALLKGLDVMLHHETKMPIHVAEDPLTAVARGTGLVLEDLDALKDVLVPTQYGKIPK